ncbi:hypothetical protein H6F89_23025 [Cyanobacteria bacterium FACHB-63]|nr:hypothetical protein [Cyanobacteria bacterium FACHB-63]
MQEFDRVQAAKRHKSGDALGFPRIVQICTDKLPEGIDPLETVRQLATQLKDSEISSS